MSAEWEESYLTQTGVLATQALVHVLVKVTCTKPFKALSKSVSNISTISAKVNRS